MIEKYGTKNYVNSEESKQKNMEQYGSEFFIQSKAFKKIMMETYGAENCMQVPEFFHKAIRSLFSTKEYKFPSGKIIHIMGYEYLTINTLMSEKHESLSRIPFENEILVGEHVPNFDYVDDNKKKHKYYPDIHVKGTKVIYEVKSIYIFNRCPRMNYLKFLSVIKQGYTLKVYLYGHKKTLVDIWTFYRCKNIDILQSMYVDKTNIELDFDKPLSYDAIDIKEKESVVDLETNIENEFLMDLVQEDETLIESF